MILTKGMPMPVGEMTNVRINDFEDVLDGFETEKPSRLISVMNMMLAMEANIDSKYYQVNETERFIETKNIRVAVPRVSFGFSRHLTVDYRGWKFQYDVFDYNNRVLKITKKDTLMLLCTKRKVYCNHMESHELI